MTTFGERKYYLAMASSTQRPPAYLVARRYGYSEVWTFWAILTTFLVMGLAAFLSGVVFHS